MRRAHYYAADLYKPILPSEQETLANLRQAMRETKIMCAVMLDTKVRCAALWPCGGCLLGGWHAVLRATVLLGAKARTLRPCCGHVLGC